MACTPTRCLHFKHDCNKCFGLSVGTVYEELWRGRDLEITNLWQRSIFLGAFMLAVAGAYGTVLMKIAFSDSPIEDIFKMPVVSKFQQEILIGLTCLGSVFSLLWCMMSKGSKYWVERYEAGIDYFTDSEYAQEMKDFDFGIPCHSNLPKGDTAKISDNPLSPLAGRYSVSKVNISIGIVSLLAWSILGIFHVGKYAETIWKIQNHTQCILLGTLVFLFIAGIAFVVLRFLCRSGDED